MLKISEKLKTYNFLFMSSIYSINKFSTRENIQLKKENFFGRWFL
tara:strand:- start:335 stop:469 length:135 start_codon:yes stop_codon:yes gene_type:complete